ncbi:MAG TPA: hypothetical protein VK466_10715 [Terriglobales bacterium]|nr:hypothetical protein [Terriglobales bacterium]
MPNLGSALRELERERARLSAKLNSIEKALSALKATGGGRQKRRLSAAALDRIRAAQKARWDKWRKAHKKA